MTTVNSLFSSDQESIVVLGSCQFPPDIIRQRAAFRTIDKLTVVAECELKKNQSVMTVLVAGDSIYADATAGLFDPVEEADRYLNAYRKILQSPQKKALDGKMAAFKYSIDDHEIDDNWEPPDPREKMLLGKHYFLYNEATDKRHPFEMTTDERKAYFLELEKIPLWRRSTVGGADLFIMDTRTERDPRCVKSVTTARMYRCEQENALFQWLDELHRRDLKEPARVPMPKFILSGSMILPRRLHCALDNNNLSAGLLSDSWDGFPASRDNLLAYIAEHDIKNVVFLSGDEHIPCVATITLDCEALKTSTTVYSLHAAPFYAPLPFANADRHDFPESDKFDLTCAKNRVQVRATVDCEFPDIGNGFMMFRMFPAFSSSHLPIEFSGDRGKENYKLALDSHAKESVFL